MLDAAKNLLLLLSALFPVVNPLGASPIFLALTQQYLPAERRALSRRIAINSFVLLVVSYFIGAHILSFFGISLPVVQVGGGLVVISSGWTILNKPDDDVRRQVQAQGQQDPLHHAFYPLTLPLTVGPGSISVAIALGANAVHYKGLNMFGMLAAVIATLLIAISIYLSYSFADRIARVLGPTAMNVILRLSSFLLVCIGVQILWNGASALLASMPVHPR